MRDSHALEEQVRTNDAFNAQPILFEDSIDTVPRDMHWTYDWGQETNTLMTPTDAQSRSYIYATVTTEQVMDSSLYLLTVQPTFKNIHLQLKKEGVSIPFLAQGPGESVQVSVESTEDTKLWLSSVGKGPQLGVSITVPQRPSGTRDPWPELVPAPHEW